MSENLGNFLTGLFGFDAVVQRVAPDQWGRPSPCESWDALGVLNRLVPGDRLEAETMSLAEEIADRAPLVIRLFKKELNQLSAGAALSADAFEEIQTLRGHAYRSRDVQEGVQAVFEKRPPRFEGK